MQKLFSYLNRILGCTDKLRDSLLGSSKQGNPLSLQANPSGYEKFSVLI